MNPRIKPKICATCSTTFPGGPTAIYCPTCRAERIRLHDRERNQRKLAGHLRHIGSTDLCTICGRPYTVKSGYQKYCEPCGAERTRQRSQESFKRQYYGDPGKRRKMIARARKWAENNKDRTAETLRKSYKRRLPEIQDRRRKMYGVKLRPLGRTEMCPRCGNGFVVRERNQRYCDMCR